MPEKEDFGDDNEGYTMFFELAPDDTERPVQGIFDCFFCDIDLLGDFFILKAQVTAVMEDEPAFFGHFFYNAVDCVFQEACVQFFFIIGQFVENEVFFGEGGTTMLFPVMFKYLELNCCGQKGGEALNVVVLVLFPEINEYFLNDVFSDFFVFAVIPGYGKHLLPIPVVYFIVGPLFVLSQALQQLFIRVLSISHNLIRQDKIKRKFRILMFF